MATDLTHTALIVVYNQIGTVNPNAGVSYLSNLTCLLGVFRSPGSSPHPPHLFHVYHRSTSHPPPSKPTIDFHPSSTPLPPQPVIDKLTNSAFVGKDFGGEEDTEGVFRGFVIDICVGTIVRHASGLGVLDHAGDNRKVNIGDIVLVKDYIAARTKDIIRKLQVYPGVSKESLRDEYARVTTTDLGLRSLLFDVFP